MNLNLHHGLGEIYHKSGDMQHRIRKNLTKNVTGVADQMQADIYTTMSTRTWQQRVRQAMEERDWNASVLERRSGVPAQTIRNWIELGKEGAFSSVVAVAKVLELDLNELAGISGPPKLAPVGEADLEDLRRSLEAALARLPQRESGGPGPRTPGTGRKG